MLFGRGRTDSTVGVGTATRGASSNGATAAALGYSRDPMQFPPRGARHFYLNSRAKSDADTDDAGSILLARLTVAQGETATVRDIGLFTDIPSAVAPGQHYFLLLKNGAPLGEGYGAMFTRPGSGPPTYLNLDYQHFDPMLEVEGPAVLDLRAMDAEFLGVTVAGTLRGWVYQTPSAGAPQ